MPSGHSLTLPRQRPSSQVCPCTQHPSPTRVQNGSQALGSQRERIYEHSDQPVQLGLELELGFPQLVELGVELFFRLALVEFLGLLRLRIVVLGLLAVGLT